MRSLMRALRSQSAVMITVGVLLLAGIGLGTVLGLLRRGPAKDTPVPQPTQDDATAVAIPAEGVEVTVKQHGSTWLPGGQYQLHLDDITGRQVLVSATDADGHVIFGPKSVRKGDTFQLPPGPAKPLLEAKVIRLENLLAGGDFGVFLIRWAEHGPTDPASQPTQ